MINLANLPKERVLIELFKNVYKKSESSKQAFARISGSCHENGAIAPIGTYEVIDDIQASSILLADMKVSTIGAVQIDIDFSTDEIDASQYDMVHKTSDNSDVLSAQQCIENLRQMLVEEKERDREMQLEIADKLKLTEEWKLKIIKAEDLLKKLLNNDTLVFQDSIENKFTLGAFPEVPEHLFLSYAKTLVSLELTVKFEKSASGLGFLHFPAQLYLLDNIDTILEKISDPKVVQQPRWCVIL